MFTTQILTALLIALSSNLDNLGVGSSYGTRGINIPFATNLLIAVITGTGTLLSMVLGQQIFSWMSEAWATLLGGTILAAVGIWVILQEFKKELQALENEIIEETETPLSCSLPELNPSSLWRRLLLILDHPFLADQDFSGHIDLREGALLGLALTLNNLPNGVAAGMLKLPVFATTLLVMALSIVMIWVGIGIGMQVSTRWLGKWAGVASGLILIGIGLIEAISVFPLYASQIHIHI